MDVGYKIFFPYCLNNHYISYKITAFVEKVFINSNKNMQLSLCLISSIVSFVPIQLLLFIYLLFNKFIAYCFIC